MKIEVNICKWNVCNMINFNNVTNSNYAVSSKRGLYKLSVSRLWHWLVRANLRECWHDAGPIRVIEGRPRPNIRRNLCYSATQWAAFPAIRLRGTDVLPEAAPAPKGEPAHGREINVFPPAADWIYNGAISVGSSIVGRTLRWPERERDRQSR